MPIGFAVVYVGLSLERWAVAVAVAVASALGLAQRSSNSRVALIAAPVALRAATLPLVVA